MSNRHNYKISIGVHLSCLILFSLLISAGCSGHNTSQLAIDGHRRTGAVSHRGIKTLCLVELENKTSFPLISADITESLYQAIQKRDLFDLTELRAADNNWKNLPIGTDSPFTLEQVMAARKMLGFDAIMVGTVTSYTPYPHMAMGLHLKIIDLRDGQIVWKTEQIWDTADKNMEERIKKYYQDQLRPGFSPLDEKLAMMSSINFLKFISFDIAKTL
jgi:hypothetical protein